MSAQLKCSAYAEGKVSQRDSGILDVIDNFDRPGYVKVDGNYGKAGTVNNPGFQNKTGKRVPRKRAAAEAGVASVEAGVSFVNVYGKVLNASASAEINPLEASAMADASLLKYGVNAGPIKAKVGVGLETGGRIGLTGAEVKLAGCGVSFGKKMGISFLGNEIAFEF